MSYVSDFGIQSNQDLRLVCYDKSTSVRLSATAEGMYCGSSDNWVEKVEEIVAVANQRPDRKLERFRPNATSDHMGVILDSLFYISS